jgi:hypothetical protein
MKNKVVLVMNVVELLSELEMAIIWSFRLWTGLALQTLILWGARIGYRCAAL